MQKNKQIVWTSLSESDFEKILDYLAQHWNNKVALHFIDLVDSQLRLIALQSKLYPLINKKKGIRKCVITKHNALFYRESVGKIEILRLYDTRQNPRKHIFK